MKMDELEEFYRILGLGPGATQEAVRQAYRDSLTAWHPDLFSHDPRIQQRAQEELSKIEIAYRKLETRRLPEDAPLQVETRSTHHGSEPWLADDTPDIYQRSAVPYAQHDSKTHLFTRRAWVYVLLFLLTIASTWVMRKAGYAITVILILLGHELGHYFMSRSYGIKATLPLFLPFPLPPFGTLGAVIRMGGVVTSRRALFDVGAAGPLASLCLSIPAITIGLRLSDVIPVSQIKEGAIRLADPLLFSFIQRLVIGEVSESFEIILHPIGYAGWVGLFVTALNLLPLGQLDGGHIVYALFGKRSRTIFSITLAVMAFITIFYNPGWGFLLILIVLFGFKHPPPFDDTTPVDWRRKVIGGIMFLAFLLSFTPVPFPQFLEEFKEILPWI